MSEVRVLLISRSCSNATNGRDPLTSCEGWKLKLTRTDRVSEALTSLNREPFDLVLLHALLPDRKVEDFMDGWRDMGFPCPVVFFSDQKNVVEDSQGDIIPPQSWKPNNNPSSLVRSVEGILNPLQTLADTRRRVQELKKQALRDHLTGLFNRRALEQKLHNIMDASRESSRPLSLLMLDLDRFKSVNDRLGHVVGDELLRETGNVLERITRKDDSVARYGGDEFCVIAPETTRYEAVRLARRLHRHLKQTLNLDEWNHGGVTCSIGISMLSPDVRSPGTLLQRADRAMYSVKEKGGDGIHVFDPRRNRRSANLPAG